MNDHENCGIAIVALTRALREARGVLVAIDSNRHDPQDERERAAVAELRRVIDLCSANLEQWGVG